MLRHAVTEEERLYLVHLAPPGRFMRAYAFACLADDPRGGADAMWDVLGVFDVGAYPDPAELGADQGC